MKILMLVNWKVKTCETIPSDIQPPDYVVKGAPYWFYRYFEEAVEVDVLDVSSIPILEKFEQYKLRFYVFQALRAIPKLHKYDLIVSHGMQSGVVVSLWRRFFRGKEKHIVFDIGSFNSAAESGGALKLMQFASKSLDGVIYHTGTQKAYYEKCFPWIVDRSRFVRFGTDSLFFGQREEVCSSKSLQKETVCAGKEDDYIVCVGYHKRDWDTLMMAYSMMIERVESVKCLGVVGQMNDINDIDGTGKNGKAEWLKQKRQEEQMKRLPILKLIGKPDYQVPNHLQLPDRAKIEMVPYIPVRQLMQQIQSALFCVLPLENFNYSFGQMTLLQQMALGKAVITARVPSMLDYVRDGENALFYEAGDAEDLCRQMQRLWMEKEWREKIGQQAARYVKEEHNEQEMAHQIEAFYREVTER